MEQLVRDVSQKAGITDDQARIAVATVTESLKKRLPSVFHRQLDHLLAGGTLSDGVKRKFDDMTRDLEEAAKHFGQRAGAFAEDVKKKMDDMWKK